MATLLDILGDETDKVKRIIITCFWKKAKAILSGTSAGAVQKKYAKALLEGPPSNSIINGVLILLQDNMDPTVEEVQEAVDTISSKLIESEE